MQANVMTDGKVFATCYSKAQLERAIDQANNFSIDVTVEHVEHDDEWCSGDASYDGENEPDWE